MSIATAFKRLHYPTYVIAQCVRWYLTYCLSLRNLEEMMAERGIHVDHSTLQQKVPTEISITHKKLPETKRQGCWIVR